MNLTGDAGRFAALADISGDTYQLFTAFMASGFTQEQALYLVGQVLTTVPLDDDADPQ